MATSSSSAMQNDSQPSASEASSSCSHDCTVTSPESLATQNDSQPAASAASSSCSHDSTVISPEDPTAKNDPPRIALSAVDKFPALEDGCSSSNALSAVVKFPATNIYKKLCGYIKQSLCGCAIHNNERPSTTSIAEWAEKINIAARKIDESMADADLEQLSNQISKLLAKFEEKKKFKKCSNPKPEPETKTEALISSNLRTFKQVISELLEVWKDVLLSDTKNVIKGLVYGMATAHLATTSLVAVAIILERCDAMKTNKKQCLSVLKDMNSLAMHLKELKQWPKLKEGMEASMIEATELVVEGSLFCCSLLKPSKIRRIRRFLFASEHKKRLDELRQRLQKVDTHMIREKERVEHGQMEGIKSQVEALEFEMQKMNDQMKELKSEMPEMNRQMKAFNCDVQGIETQIKETKFHMEEMKGQVEIVKNLSLHMEEMKGQVEIVKTLLQTTVEDKYKDNSNTSTPPIVKNLLQTTVEDKYKDNSNTSTPPKGVKKNAKKYIWWICQK